MQKLFNSIVLRVFFFSNFKSTVETADVRANVLIILPIGFQLDIAFKLIQTHYTFIKFNAFLCK